MRISTTRCVWPEVSPFFQSALRERLKYQASPVAMVLASASLFICATISTSPDFASVATVVMSPLASNLGVSAVPSSSSAAAAAIPRIGRLEQPDASATALSKLCGSTVTIDLKMDGDTVTDFAHEVKACALGQASSSIMARNIVGSKASELKALREGVRKMLKENGAPPANGKWADIAVLEPVRGYKARHASTLLTFDAVVDAIDQIEAKRGIR